MNAEYMRARQSIFRENGEYYGYPDCCIQNFCKEGFDPNVENIYVNGKLNTSGFIPCQNHKNEILAGKIRLADLIDYKKRKAPGRFKEDWSPVKIYHTDEEGS